MNGDDSEKKKKTSSHDPEITMALDEDLPTMETNRAELPEPEWDGHDLPTLQIASSLVALIEQSVVESTLELPKDALPIGPSEPALPFPPGPRDDVAEVARIAAELESGSRLAVLARRRLTESRWNERERACAERIVGALEEGETELRDAYDDAFLVARAAVRGAFETKALVLLREELSKRDADDRSPGLGLDIADAMRVQRVALRRRAPPFAR